MKEFYTSGTLGDSYIECCKLTKIEGAVRVYHFTIHTDWHPLIREIFNLRKDTEVSFIDEPSTNFVEITSNIHDGDMNFFPQWNIKSKIRVLPPYHVIQTHSGKPGGNNAKYLHPSVVKSIVDRSAINNVLLGTEDEYKSISSKKCINLIGKTSIYNCIDIVSRSEKFIGLEGLLSFVAVSQKVRSVIMYTSLEAVHKRIMNSPWESYCNLVDVSKTVGGY